MATTYRLAWITDPHLDFLSRSERERFVASLRKVPADGFAIGGDIAEAPDLLDALSLLDGALRTPVYFVLGNHDYFGSTIAEVEARVASFASRSRRSQYLPSAGVVALTERTCLLGHGLVGDARAGDPMGSQVELTDFTSIGDLAGLSRERRVAVLQGLGTSSAAWIRRHLPGALERFENVVFLSHVPPFAAAAWHEGRASSPDFAPYFACVAAGEALRELARSRPERTVTALCGHTHGGGTLSVLPNLRVITGAAAYGAPAVTLVLDVP